jgi:Zn-dependent M28 family amino/carboxypeptidase
LAPGNGDSYLQPVPLVEITVRNQPRLAIRGNGTTNRFSAGSEFIVWTKRVVERAQLSNSELVFVGYGVVAPEYDWNDYEGVDVTGKTVVILVNDPGFATQDAALFNGNTMTYYGRWTYKYEEATRQGAAAALVVHETEPAGYPWAVVENSWTGPQFDLESEDANMSRVALEGWVTLDVARTIFSQAGEDYDVLKEQAASREFQATSLGVTASVSITNNLEQSRSNNVVGVWQGSDRADEYVVYMAHWDHFGRDESLEGDQIYNGAFDNATGMAGLLELAESYTRLEERPSRSVLFLAVTAEEFGLLGSAYYATHPVYPRNKTVAAINMDGLNIYGPMNDITVIGHGNSELDEYLEAAARDENRVVRGDPEPEKGFYYRSDHFSFAKEGIPALYTDNGIDHVEHGEEWTMARRDEYTAQRYHKPSDEFDPNWDLSGAVDDLRILFVVGYRIAASDDFPNWREGTEFKAKRDADMGSRE